MTQTKLATEKLPDLKDVSNWQNEIVNFISPKAIEAISKIKQSRSMVDIRGFIETNLLQNLKPTESVQKIKTYNQTFFLLKNESGKYTLIFSEEYK